MHHFKIGQAIKIKHHLLSEYKKHAHGVNIITKIEGDAIFTDKTTQHRGWLNSYDVELAYSIVEILNQEI